MSMFVSVPLSMNLISAVAGIYGYFLFVLMILLCLWLWRKMKKKRDEELRKIWIRTCISTVFFSVFFCAINVFTSLPIEYQTENKDVFMKATVSLLLFSFIFYFVLQWYFIGRNKLKIDGIKYWLDRTSRTASVLPNKYSGDIVIPSSIVTLKDGATYLVTDFDKNAFVDCGELTSVTIPDGVTCICNSAFLDCKALKSVTISKSVTDIGYDPFLNCINLTTIKVANGNPKYDSRDNCNAIIETATNTLVFGCKNTTIPKSVTCIEGAAFESCRGLTTITIPESVTSIGEYGFADCENLRDVVCLAEQVPTTPNEAFEDTPISQATLHVPAASIEAYRAAKPWSLFENIVPIK